MKHWIGLAMFAGGAWLIQSAMADNRRALAARQRQAQEGGGEGAVARSASLDALGAIMPPIIYVFLVIGGAISSAEFLALDHGRNFSLLDLAGFLFLLAAYGYSVSLRARRRFSNGAE